MILQIANVLLIILGSLSFFEILKQRNQDLVPQNEIIPEKQIQTKVKQLQDYLDATVMKLNETKIKLTNTEKSLNETKQEIQTVKSSYLNFLYQHPENEILGRPFSGLISHSHILQEYLDAPTITIDQNNKIYPHLFTGISENHFEEHRENSHTVFKHFPGQKIVVYDAGLTKSQSHYFKNHSNYIYRKFDFERYPTKTTWLTGMSWKVLVHMLCLIEFKACQWFDASIVFSNSTNAIVDEYVYARKSSFVYYIRPAGHTTPWSTHPFMFAYLPSNITKMNSKSLKMPQSGAQILYNTEELREKMMKWAVACALTPECMFPNYELNEVRIPYGTRFNPYGTFEHKHCSAENHPLRPFNCHRYDQSLFAVLVQNMYDYDLTKYRTLPEEWPGSPDRTAGRKKNG